ncbi:MAG: amino acid ABC transporter substrate-binding protein [Parachlamydiaceae bacterium]|nr:amino acid ABC transporter substrate-binding protein [Parachlamydiaceae bacterium]
MNKLQRLWRIKSVRRSIVIAGVALGLLVLVRACSAIIMPQEYNTYHVAHATGWYPLDLFGKESNLEGFTDDLLYAISRSQEIDILPLTINPNIIFENLNNRKYDGVLALLPTSSQNKRIYELSEPFYPLGPVLVVKSSTQIDSLKDMEGKIVGVRTGASLIFNLDQYPSVIIRSYDNMIHALNELDNNIIDGVVLNSFSASSYTTGIYAGRLKIVTAPLTDEGLRLVTLKNADGKEFVDYFNAGLKALKEDGTYDKLLKKWGMTQ